MRLRLVCGIWYSIHFPLSYHIPLRSIYLILGVLNGVFQDILSPKFVMHSFPHSQTLPSITDRIPYADSAKWFVHTRIVSLSLYEGKGKVVPILK
jgi:hypothetical protein